MSDIHNNGSNDHDLERLGQAYEQLRQEQPPDLLDQAVLNSARRAVEKKPHWMKFTWLHGLTTAAVFVLAFSLVLNQREPLPDFEGGIQATEPDLEGFREPVKKQLEEHAADTLRLQQEAKGEMRQDSARRMRAPTPAAPSVTAAAEEAKTTEVMKSGQVREFRTGISAEVDKDTGEIMQEIDDQALDMAAAPAEVAETESDVVASTPAVAEPAGVTLEDMPAKAEQDPDIEQKIHAIIELKRSGDPGWQTELAAFRESYPDYPLPAELKN
jgi:hypothetical protein